MFYPFENYRFYPAISQVKNGNAFFDTLPVRDQTLALTSLKK